MSDNTSSDKSPGSNVPSLVGEAYFFPENKEKTAYVRCPECGRNGWIDADQWCGATSIDCPNCEYHETVDLRSRFHLD